MDSAVSLSQIIGCWELVRFEIKDQEGGTSSWGDNSAGLLIYTEDGHMSVSINSKAIFGTDDSQAILDGILFYSGRYRLIGEEIRHQVLFASSPSRVGTEMVREVSLTNGHMLLTARGDFGVAELSWRRIYA